MNLLRSYQKQMGAIRVLWQSQSGESAEATFPILLKLDWMLLAFTLLSGILVAPFLPDPGPTIVVIFASVVTLGVMRLWQFPQLLKYKILYTAIELAILLVPPLFDANIRPMPPLIFIIVIRSCQMFRLPGRLMVSSIIFSAFAFAFSLRDPIPRAFIHSSETGQIQNLPLRLTAISSFGLALVFILLLINALMEERQSRSKLIIAHEQLRQYALQIEDQSTLQERNRIAREIHDSLGHTLTAQSIQLDGALLLLKTDIEKANSFLQISKQLCTQALQEVRQSVMTLRVDPLQGQSFDRAIASLINEFRATTAIATHYTTQVSTLPNPISAATYRILQEALTNMTRHSEASCAMIRIFEQDQKLFLVIKDNGKGFHPAQNSTGFGLQSMRERTAALGGRFTVLSQPGDGCLITVQLPLPQIS